jgi:hypothetical protein
MAVGNDEIQGYKKRRADRIILDPADPKEKSLSFNYSSDCPGGAVSDEP